MARRSRPTVVLAAAAVGAALLAAAPAGPAVAAAAAPRTTAHAARPVADPEVQAQAQARRTGMPVLIPSLTTATSQTQALPSGQFKMTTSSQPVRTWTHDAWQTLNATLQPNRDGTWSPAVSTSPVTISGGGTGPLATMTASGRGLSLYWPGTLPRPAVSGDTAVYSSVLPGVDLRITVDTSGGASDVLVIRNRAAAASPALRRLALTAQTTGGLRLAPGPSGTLQAATKGGAPAFTATAPLMWDSATTAASPATSRTSASQGLVAAGLAAPATSSASQPGRHAHVARVKISLGRPQRVAAGSTRQSLTLIPNASVLNGRATVYPAYIDPWFSSGGSRGWYASDASEYASTNYYDNTADPAPEDDLQVGYNDTFTADSFVNMQLNSSELKNADINSATIQFTEETSYSCTPTPVELWQVGAVPEVNSKPWVSWNDEPAPVKYTGTGALSDGAITSQTAAHGYTGCAAGFVLFDISNFMQDKGPAGPSSITFELKAPDAGDDLEWKEFSNAAGAITMTTYYDHRPNAQTDSLTEPGGACQSTSAADTVIGNDDVTLETTPSDPEGGTLWVHFVVEDAGTTTTLTNTEVAATSGKPISLTIPRSQIQGWQANGSTAAYPYAWWAYTYDGLLDNEGSNTSLGSKTKPCLFTYNPAFPDEPAVNLPAYTDSVNDIGTLGGTASFLFGECTGALDTTQENCSEKATPTQYVYSVNDGPQATINITGTTQQVTIPLTLRGVNTLSVSTLTTAGNPSPAFTIDYDVAAPANAYGDDDYAGTGHPDLITVGDGTGTADHPGLWLSESDGAGTLASSTPIDIGARGTGLNTNGSPADWASTQVLTGDFTGNKVQDIVAYYPSGNNGGTLQMIGGPGTAARLDLESGNTATIYGYGSSVPVGSQNPLGDFSLDGGADTPFDLVAAGNASLGGDTLPDLIGILGDSVNGYEVNIYNAASGDTFSTAYGNIAASTGALTPAGTQVPGPDGSPWGPNWSLAAAQHVAIPVNGATVTEPVLFALDKANGQLWESVNQPSNATTTACPLSSDFLIGMPCSIWTRITGGPWGTNSGPTLAQADVNTAGNIELWTTSGGTATSWTVPPPGSGTSLTKEVANTPVNPGHAWPLTDGAAAEATGGSGTLIDTESDSGNATPGSAVTFTGDGGAQAADPVLGSAAVFNGMSGSALTMPAGLLQDTTSSHLALPSMTLTLKFRAQPGATGILVGTSTGTLSSPVNSSAPILYIGTDGRLYAEFPSAHVGSGVFAPQIAPLVSSGPVDDGQWHTVTLVADGSRHQQVLYLDNNVPIYSWDDGYVDPADPTTIINPGQTASGGSYSQDQVTMGAGVFSTYGWPAADITGGAAGATRASYFTGEIADVIFYPEIFARGAYPTNVPGNDTTAITSGALASQCVELQGGVKTDGTPVEIDTCNGGGAQKWVISPGGTIQYAPDGAFCLNVTSNGTANGTPVELYGCNGTNGQYWQVLPNGSIMNIGSGKCLDDPHASTTTGTQLDIYSCNSTPAQLWGSDVEPSGSVPVGTIVNFHAGLCISNAGGSPTSAGSTTAPSAAQDEPCTGYLSQQLSYYPDGSIRVAGLCLNNTGGNASNGNVIDFTTCNQTAAQVWGHLDNGEIVNPTTGMCVQGSGTAGTGVQLWTCSSATDPTWVTSGTWNN
jgi:hypothetical protein